MSFRGASLGTATPGAGRAPSPSSGAAPGKGPARPARLSGGRLPVGASKVMPCLLTTALVGFEARMGALLEHPLDDGHRFFRALRKLWKREWGLEIHELALRLLERAGCHDGLDVYNLSIPEKLLRHVQLAEHAYTPESVGRDKGKGESAAGLNVGAALFTGTYQEVGNAMVSPDLPELVGKGVERGAGVLKQPR